MLVRSPGSDMLPTAPTDAERDSYFVRRMGLLLAVSLTGFALTLVSASKFAASHASWYWLVIGAAVAYVAIAAIVNVGTRDARGDEHRARVEGYAPERWASVDVMLPTCGEPLAVLQNTWAHVARLDWPGRINVYVLDDAGREEVRQLAVAQRFHYLARPNAGWMKKAGNLRHGFERSAGEVIAVFDADFCPRPDFLRELMPYMTSGVGIVQSPQFFRTLPGQGWLERGAGAVQEFFYRAIQVSRERHDGAICVGSNALYRREALAANGGTTLIEHSEDVHTGFDLRRLGWRLTYVPVPLATGLCPDDLGGFFRQQYRWCMGSMSLLGSGKFWRTPMGLRTRCCYLSGFCYYAFTAAATFVMPIVPLTLLLAYPEAIRLENYAILLPGLAYGFLVFPAWHRCRYRLEAWSVKLVYGWAHLFALIDLARRRPMGWTPTGAKPARDLRFPAFRVASGAWGLGTAALWLGAASMHAAVRPLDFLPMLLLGSVYAVTNVRLFAPARPVRRRAPRLRWATAALALAFLGAAPAIARADFGVIASDRATFQRYERGLGPIEQRGYFWSWGVAADPAKLLAVDRRLGTTPVISWEPWKPPPLGEQNQGRWQPRYAMSRIAAGAWDGYVRSWARAIRAFRRPVELRFAHEMQGDWYPWSQDPAAYRRAWRHVWTVFRREGARNARWVWSPNSWWSDIAVVRAYWPGRRYVDKVAMTALTFTGRERPAWYVGQLRALADAFGKPVSLSEVNVVFSEREAWLRELVAQVRANPWIRGVMWSQPVSRGEHRHAPASRMSWSGWRDPVARPLLRDLRRDVEDR